MVSGEKKFKEIKENGMRYRNKIK
jgi:hypothetical protein